MDNRGFYTGIWEGRVVRTKGPYSNRPECHYCVSSVGGRCIVLMGTNWIKNRECPFLATEKRLLEDKQKLQKAIEEGRVDPKQYG